MKRKTWKVIGWDGKPNEAPGESLELACPKCGNDAWMPTAGHPGNTIIAVIGMGIVFDQAGHVPPIGWLPNVLECRKCHTIWTDEK